MRYYVCRHYIKWKGVLYKKGEFLPEDFSERERVRHIHSSRIAMMPELPRSATLEKRAAEQAAQAQTQAARSSTTKAAGTKPISGEAKVAKSAAANTKVETPASQS